MKPYYRQDQNRFPLSVPDKIKFSLMWLGKCTCLDIPAAILKKKMWEAFFH